MDDTNFVDGAKADLYIDDMDEDGEASHGDGSNNPSDESYEDAITEYRPNKGDIENAAYNKYMCDEAMMDVPGGGPMRATVRCCVEDFNGSKVGTYHQNPLMDN